MSSNDMMEGFVWFLREFPVYKVGNQAAPAPPPFGHDEHWIDWTAQFGNRRVTKG